jgi:hypothetical protein
METPVLISVSKVDNELISFRLDPGSNTIGVSSFLHEANNKVTERTSKNILEIIIFDILV